MDLEALMIEAAARIAHEVNRAYCEAMGDRSQPPWAAAPDWQKKSAIAGMEYFHRHPDAAPGEMHEQWLKLKVDEGWFYGPVKDAEKKTHPCMMSFLDLPREQQVKDYLFLAVAKVTMVNPLTVDEVATVDADLVALGVGDYVVTHTADTDWPDHKR